MDDYIVRLGGAPTTAPPAVPTPTSASAIREVASSSTPQAPPKRGWRRWRRWVVLGVIALVVASNPGIFTRAVERVADEAKKPVQSLNGEAELRKATAYFSGLYSNSRSYDADEDDMKVAVPDVHWGEVIHVEHCFDGRGVVLVAGTVRGSISRLLVSGDDVGDLAGEESCPESPDNVSPWVK